MKVFIFPLWVSNSKVEKQKFNLRVSNSKWNLMLNKVDLVTRKKNLYENFRVSSSKCDVISRNSISLLEFRTSITRYFQCQDFQNSFFFLFLVERLKDSYACYNLFCFDSMDVLKKVFVSLDLTIIAFFRF